jgi:hypothetical protein
MSGPTEFTYLHDVARKYHLVANRQQLEALFEGNWDERLRELAEVYEEIDHRKDDLRISHWLSDGPIGNPKDKKDADFKWDVGRLFLAFDYLASKDIPPFSSLRVVFTDQIRRPNWNNLPHELNYLIEVAEAYAAHSTEGEMLDFLEHAHEKDLEILARTAERIRLNGHIKTINEWMDRFDMVEHQEAWMVYCVLGLLDHAGLKFES